MKFALQLAQSHYARLDGDTDKGEEKILSFARDIVHFLYPSPSEEIKSEE